MRAPCTLFYWCTLVQFFFCIFFLDVRAPFVIEAQICLEILCQNLPKEPTNLHASKYFLIRAPPQPLHVPIIVHCRSVTINRWPVPKEIKSQ